MQWRSSVTALVTAGSAGCLDVTTLVTTLAIFALGLAFARLILLAIGTIADKIEAL